MVFCTCCRCDSAPRPQRSGLPQHLRMGAESTFLVGLRSASQGIWLGTNQGLKRSRSLLDRQRWLHLAASVLGVWLDTPVALILEGVPGTRSPLGVSEGGRGLWKGNTSCREGRGALVPSPDCSMQSGRQEGSKHPGASPVCAAAHPSPPAAQLRSAPSSPSLPPGTGCGPGGPRQENCATLFWEREHNSRSTNSSARSQRRRPGLRHRAGPAGAFFQPGVLIIFA